jgi:hypothetical protein
MTERDNILTLLNSEAYESVPIWFMGFDNEDVARNLNPEYEFPANLSHNPERENYPWDRISDDERRRTIIYNRALLKPVTTIGWGANMPLGHGGPGEFHFSLTELKENERILVCETGCKRLVKKNPHFYMDYDYPMKTLTDLDKLVLPDPHDQARYKGFDDDVRFFKEAGYLTAANLNGFFSGPHYFCLEYQEFLISILLDPPNSKKLIDTIGAWNIAAAEELLARGVECIILCDDLGSADNLLVSPEIYKEWIYPWHKKLCGLAHEHGAYVHLHSHGNIRKVLPYVLSAGVDMLNPFDKNESMDLVEFLENNPKSRTVPVGGLHKNFFAWDRDIQNEYLTSLFRNAKKAGRWMLMDPSGIPATVSKETYDFVREKAYELRRL